MSKYYVWQENLTTGYAPYVITKTSKKTEAKTIAKELNDKFANLKHFVTAKKSVYSQRV